MLADVLRADALEMKASNAYWMVFSLMQCADANLIPQAAVKLERELQTQAKEARRLSKISAEKVVEALTHVSEFEALMRTTHRLMDVEARLETREALHAAEERLMEAEKRLDAIEGVRALKRRRS